MENLKRETFNFSKSMAMIICAVSQWKPIAWDDQPGNGCVIFKNEKFDRYPLPFSWKELIVDPIVQCIDFVEKRHKFSNSKREVKAIYHNRYANDSP